MIEIDYFYNLLGNSLTYGILTGFVIALFKILGR